VLGLGALYALPNRRGVQLLGRSLFHPQSATASM
jgi:hypothetical protein